MEGSISLLRSTLDKVWQYVEDPTVTEIYVNEDQSLWIENFSEGRHFTGKYLDIEDINLVNTVVAGGADEIINSDSPELAVEIYDLGFRFQGVVPPIVKNPVFMIRKRATVVFSLAQYVEQGTITNEQKLYIEKAILERRNILVIGSTGSGKTTFLNAILKAISELTPSHRLVILEDLPELQCEAEDFLAMKTTKNKAVSVDMDKLLFITMRLSPTRIIIGEVRDKSAYSMLKAWNTGHQGGICTTHADSCKDGLARLEVLTREDPQAGDCRGLIGNSVDIIISIQKVVANNETKRLVNEIIEIKTFNFNTSEYEIEKIF